MRPSIFPTIATLLLLCAFVLGQQTSPAKPPTFSESAVYTPHVFPGKKKKEEKRDPVPGQPPITDQLSFPLAVFDKKSELVKDLRSDEITIFVDGSPVPLERLEKVQGPLNLVLLFDVSPSAFVEEDPKVNSVNEVMKSLASRLLSKLGAEDRVMVARFANDLKVLTEFTNDRNLVSKAIKNLERRDGTGLYNAMTELLEKKLVGHPFPTAIIIMTDGVDTVSRKASYESSLLTAENSSIPVYPIYFDTFEASKRMAPRGLPPGLSSLVVVGSSQEEFELGKYYVSDLTALSGGHGVLASNVTAGKSWAFDILVDELRSQYQATIKLPPGKQSGERHHIRVRIERPDLTVLTKATYIEQ